MNPRTAIALIASCTLALSACGSSDDEKKGTVAGPSLDAAGEVVVDYVQKVLAGDEAACDLETPKFTAAENKLFDATDCKSRVAQLKDAIAMAAPDLDPENVEVKVRAGASKSEALVDLSLDDSGDSTYRLIVVDGSWLIDEDVDGEDAGDGDEAGDGDQPDATAKEWASAWCEVKPGISKKDLLALMGGPTEQETDDDGQPELTWKSGSAMFVAWLDADGTVTNTSASGIETDC